MGATETWSRASAAEIAEASGVEDLFLFRRLCEGRFAHIGGAGRGAGWAGIVEIGVEAEPFVSGALSVGSVVRRSAREPWHVLGPYYGSSVALVPVTDDMFVVFGTGGAALESISDNELLELARLAGETLVEVAPAKRLADELEALTAVKELLHDTSETFDGAFERLVQHATTSLSCDLGVGYVVEGGRVQICDRRVGEGPLDAAAAAAALAVLAGGETFPVCVQSALSAELPAPFRSADGVVAYYLLEIRHPTPGLLLLLHTDAVLARGFTSLCQSLGHRLVEAAEPMLHSALLRDTLRARLEQAESDARRDPLTGLPNRLAWAEWLSAARACSEDPATVVKLDCRGLRRVNETLGHRAGDRLLCHVASILSGAIGPHDRAARLGGDEFSLLLCGASEEAALAVVERIEEAVAAESPFEGVDVGLSIGAATTRDGEIEAAEHVADARMFEVKRLGRAAVGKTALSDSAS